MNAHFAQILLSKFTYHVPSNKEQQSTPLLIRIHTYVAVTRNSTWYLQEIFADALDTELFSMATRIFRASQKTVMDAAMMYPTVQLQSYLIPLHLRFMTHLRSLYSLQNCRYSYGVEMNIVLVGLSLLYS